MFELAEFQKQEDYLLPSFLRRLGQLLEQDVKYAKS